MSTGAFLGPEFYLRDVGRLLRKAVKGTRSPVYGTISVGLALTTREVREFPLRERGSALKKCKPAEQISTVSTYHRSEPSPLSAKECGFIITGEAACTFLGETLRWWTTPRRQKDFGSAAVSREEVPLA
jgi:hypothetical protein